MKSHEIKTAAAAFGEHSEDIPPLIPAGAPTRRRSMRCSRHPCVGRDVRRTAKLMLIPEAEQGRHRRQRHRAMYVLASVMVGSNGGGATWRMTDDSLGRGHSDRNAL
jgi:glutamate synthase (NADPH/NADH) large chain